MYTFNICAPADLGIFITIRSLASSVLLGLHHDSVRRILSSGIVGRFVTQALDGESVSHGGLWVRLYKGLQHGDICFFVFSANVRLFVGF